MINKYDVQGKLNKVVGKLTDDKVREWKGIGQSKYGEIKRKAHMHEMDVSSTSILSLVFGILLIASGLYFVIRAKDDLC